MTKKLSDFLFLGSLCILSAAGPTDPIPSHCCAFPFTLNGVEHYKCFDDGGGLGCFYGDRVWKLCVQPAGKRNIHKNDNNQSVSQSVSQSLNQSRAVARFFLLTGSDLPVPSHPFSPFPFFLFPSPLFASLFLCLPLSLLQ